MRPLQKRLGRQSLSNAMPKRRQIVDSCILFLTTSRSTEPPKRMPKSRHIVDSLTLLFTTSRSTEAAKHDAQSETNRRFSQSPFHDVQVDRRSQTRFPSRDYGRHNLKKYRFSMNVGRREAANLGTCRVIKLSLVERPQMKIVFGFSAKGSDRVEELAVQWSRLQ